MNSQSNFRIVVTGLIGSIPIAGLTMHYLQYPLGLRDLGYDVLYLEDTGSWYYDPASDSMHGDSAKAVRYLDQVMRDFGLSDAWSFVDHGGNGFGVSGQSLDDFISSSSVMINVTGAGIIRDEYLAIPRRAYVDTDPAFLQFRLASQSHKDLDHLRRHNSFFSFGCNLGDALCQIPTAGFSWHPTVQPIVMSLWPVSEASPGSMFTTVTKWKTYDPVKFGGKVYGLKDEEFPAYQNLPKLTNARLEIAGVGTPPCENLQRHGWQLRDAVQVTSSIPAYQNYIRESAGEWSIAKGAYVRTRSGWFSERSACYLASGRPVVVQDTGFTDWLKCDGGVLPFSTPAEAAQQLDSVISDYSRHCCAARQIAEIYFDSQTVLTKLVASAMSE